MVWAESTIDIQDSLSSALNFVAGTRPEHLRSVSVRAPALDLTLRQERRSHRRTTLLVAMREKSLAHRSLGREVQKHSLVPEMSLRIESRLGS